MKKLLGHQHIQKDPMPKCKSSIVPLSWDKAFESQFTSIVDTRTGKVIKPFGMYVTRT